MRHSLILFAAAAFVAVFSLGATPAQATPLPKLNQIGAKTLAVEPVGYYRRRGYRPYRYGRSYRYYRRPYAGYYRPYRRPYYRNYYYRPYAYRRPYYGRRYYW